MSRAEALSVALEYLHKARDGLRQATRTLELCDLIPLADETVDLRQRVCDIYSTVNRQADAAHRKEHPGAYDATGRWVGYRND